MRRKLIFTIFMLMMLSTGVSYGEVKDKPVASITLISGPQRIVYDVGEAIDLYGMQVKVVFTDGEEYTAGYTDLTCEGYNPQQEGSQLLIAKYGDYSVPFSVKVQQGTLRSISVSLKTTDTYWIAGKSLTKNNFIVTGSYDVGSSREVTDFVFNPSLLEVGRNVITVSYRDKSATVVIDARENSCQSIRVETPGTSEFQVGEPFNWRGLKVIAHYLDDTEKDVTSDCIVKGVVTSRQGRQYAEVTYKDKIVTYPVDVINMVFDRLDVEHWTDENIVYVYYQNKEEPVAVGPEAVYVTDDNKAGMRTFMVTYAGKTYQTNVSIPAEERKYINSKRVTVQVPIGITLKTNDGGELGYVAKTPLKSLTESTVGIKVSPVAEIPKLQGLPVALSVPKMSTIELTLDIPREKYADSKVQEYYRFNVELEVH